MLGGLQSTLDELKASAHATFVAPFTEPTSDKLLPDLPARMRGKELPTLVLALDDVLVHASWDRQYGWRFAKRPGVDEFLRTVAPYYEVVVWTEQFYLMEPVIVALDKHRAVRHRLYKDGMVLRGGKYVKDLRHLNRALGKTVVLDCRAENGIQQPENYLFVKPFTGEDSSAMPSAAPVAAAAASGAAAPATSTPPDSDLTRFIPVLLHLARHAYVQGGDVRSAPTRAAHASRAPRRGAPLRQLTAARLCALRADRALAPTHARCPAGRRSRGCQRRGMTCRRRLLRSSVPGRARRRGESRASSSRQTRLHRQREPSGSGCALHAGVRPRRAGPHPGGPAGTTARSLTRP